jgi:Lrp/AsnC family transcriptional regulator, regulator of ectoine-degradation genes
MTQLDERDIRILSILQTEGRITKSALAEKVHLSATACWDRLQRLQKEGYILGYQAQINQDLLGDYVTVLMEASLKNHESRDFDRFEQAVKEIEEITECWSVGGGIDYILKFTVSSINEYQRLVDKMLNEEIGLNRYYTYIVTKTIKQSCGVPDRILHNLR